MLPICPRASITRFKLWGKDEKSEAEIRFAFFGCGDCRCGHLYGDRFGRRQQADSELSAVQSLVDSVASNGKKAGGVDPNSLKTKTPIKHLVVVFNENRSFDHYFATYPNATNPESEPIFEPAKNTPRDINNLTVEHRALIDNNPNGNPQSYRSLRTDDDQPGLNRCQCRAPFRLDRTQVDTAGQNHNYISGAEGL